MRTIACSSPFIPPEWIAAHGLRSRRLVPRAPVAHGPSRVREGVCCFAHAYTLDAAGLDDAGIVFTTTCDPMRRSAEATGGPERTFLFNVPATWQTVATQQRYVAELGRMGAWMVRMGGAAPDAARLVETLRRWDVAREQARARRSEMSARGFAEALIELHASGIFPETVCPPAPNVSAFPVALVGGPLLLDEFWLYDCIEGGGARVALDATETGERGLAAPFDRRRLRDEPMSVLADAYFGQMPDAFRRPNTRLYEYLKSGFAERGVRAVILIRRVWCDLWHAEAARIREWCGLPCISVDLSGEGDLRQRAATAVQALVESAG
jgi:hypothetical protein